MVAIVKAYGDWLATSNVPKLFLKAEPGGILSSDKDLAFVRRLPAQTEVTVAGVHYVQEDSPDEIGRAISAWMKTLDTALTTYAVQFWDVTNRQDWAACESVQRGLGSPFAQPGPLSPAEDAVYSFVTTVARGYLGERVTERPAQAGTAAADG